MKLELTVQRYPATQLHTYALRVLARGSGLSGPEGALDPTLPYPDVATLRRQDKTDVKCVYQVFFKLNALQVFFNIISIIYGLWEGTVNRLRI